MLESYLYWNSVIPPFKTAAEEMVSSSSLSAVELLAKALAKLSVSYLIFLNYVIMSFHTRWLFFLTTIYLTAFWLIVFLQGYTEIKSRSLLTSMENHVTLILEAGKPIFSPS